MGAPELPFGEAADERAELIVTRRGERRSRGLAALFNLVSKEVVLERGVETGLEEGEEEVEEVDRVGVCVTGGSTPMPIASIFALRVHTAYYKIHVSVSMTLAGWEATYQYTTDCGTKAKRTYTRQAHTPPARAENSPLARTRSSA